MDRLKSTYIDRDDGLHPYENPEYFEWWYLDARFDNGYSCVLTWHWRNEFLKPHIPTLQIFTYTPEGKRYVGMEAVDPKDCHASQERCDVKMGKSFLRQENGVYKMFMHCRNVGCELVFKPSIPGWKTGDGVIPVEGKDLVQGWVIPCPRAKVEGKLIIKDKEIPVKGDGYHDHNWGNCDMYDIFRGWYWGRLNDPKYTIIFSRTEPLEGQALPYLYIADDKGTLLSTNEYKFSVEKEEPDQATGIPYAKIISLKYGGTDIDVNCRLETKQVVEHNTLPKVNEFNMYNWRFLAGYKGDIKIGNAVDRVEGETIHERLLFRS